MDALSSMATVAGYKGVLLAANRCPACFRCYDSGRHRCARACSSSVPVSLGFRRSIGAPPRRKVEAYDVRPAVKEQVQSLGARLELPLESLTRKTRAATPRPRTNRSTAASAR